MFSFIFYRILLTRESQNTSVWEGSTCRDERGEDDSNLSNCKIGLLYKSTSELNLVYDNQHTNKSIHGYLYDIKTI